MISHIQLRMNCAQNTECDFPKVCVWEMALGNVFTTSCACPAELAYVGERCNEPTPLLISFVICIVLVLLLTMVFWTWTGFKLWHKVQEDERCSVITLAVMAVLTFFALCALRIYVILNLHAAMSATNTEWQAGLYLLLTDAFMLISLLVLLLDWENDKATVSRRVRLVLGLTVVFVIVITLGNWFKLDHTGLLPCFAFSIILIGLILCSKQCLSPKEEVELDGYQDLKTSMV